MDAGGGNQFSYSGGGNQFPRSVSLQDKSCRNKRKFNMEDPSKILLPKQVEHPNCDFEKFKSVRGSQQHSACDFFGFTSQEVETVTSNFNSLSCQEPCDADYGECGGFEIDGKESQDVDWNDVTQSQLEELVLINLDTIFKTAIKKIVSIGYSEEIAMKAVSRLGICYGSKDTVSNIVENALEFLKNDKEVVSASEMNIFEDLQQLESYMLAEMVCVLKEVRPFFSTGDAMWCLLMCDMNASHACAMDFDPLNSVCGEDDTEVSSGSTALHLKSEGRCSIPSTLRELKECLPSSTNITGESSVFGKKCASTIRKKSPSSSESKSNQCRKIKWSKGASRSAKLSGLNSLFSDKKYKSAAGSSILNTKNSFSKASKEIVANPFPENNSNPSVKGVSVSNRTANAEAGESFSRFPLASGADSLAFYKENANASNCECHAERSGCDYCGISSDELLGQCILREKDEILLKLIRLRELQKQMQDWTEWTQHKVMQAARRLNKDKAELMTLRQEKEEVARLKKEKLALEDSTMKKLAEMENALCKAGGQVERANAAVHRLELENYALSQDLEDAKLQAAKSALSCQEVSLKEKNALKEFHSWDRQLSIFQENLITEKLKHSQLQQQVEHAKEVQNQLEARWRKEEEVKEEVLKQVISVRDEREQIMEALAKSNEDLIVEENILQKSRDDIRRLHKEIVPLKSKTDSSRLAALRDTSRQAVAAYRAGNLNSNPGSNTYASRLKSIRNIPALEDSNSNCSSELSYYTTSLRVTRSIPATESNQNCDPEMATYSQFIDLNRVPSTQDANPSYISRTVDFQDSEIEDVQRERECVMCLTDEISVVFLPCAHQIVCLKCNELHDKQGMKSCPSCRTPIQRRICVRLGHL